MQAVSSFKGTAVPLVRARLWITAMIVCAAATGCRYTPETALERLVEARRMAAELRVQFTKAADAANRAVIADTDEASTAFASEAGQATQAVQAESDALAPILMFLGYSAEARLLEEFDAAFAEYRALDSTILGLAVENTNLKAQRLSFGSAHAAADSFSHAVENVTPLAASDAWRVKALAATALANLREIQVLEAPHIAEADDVAMARMEKQMAASEAAARNALDQLGPLVSPASRPQVASATAALDRFMALHAEIIVLSRRNSNVRSLALSLGQKRTLTARGEAALRALQDALAKRELGGTR
jgi:hypothetical protein